MEEVKIHLVLDATPAFKALFQPFMKELLDMSKKSQEALQKALDTITRTEGKVDGLKAYAEGLPALFKQAIDDAIKALPSDATTDDLADALNVKADELATHTDDVITAFNNATTPTPAPAPAPSDTTVGGQGSDTVTAASEVHDPNEA